MSDKLDKEALDYHRYPVPGKLQVTATKPLANQYDLSLAYSPGVAAASRSIAADESEAAALTARGNLVAVISNGTAVLGLGNIGALASKPVMEGKAGLFKKFAGIDVFDIEIDEDDPEQLIKIIKSLEPTFGGINLEDIKAPECFVVENQLKQDMNIPVMHDDQHGTAIIVAAAVLNGLKIANKDIKKVKLVCSGAGAAALACLDLLVKLGLNKNNIFFAEGFMHSYHPQFTKLTEILNEKKIGEIIEMESSFGVNIVEKKNFFGFKKIKINKKSRLFKKELAGGCILDLGCYPSSFSILMAKLKSETDLDKLEIKNVKKDFGSIDVDLEAYAELHFNNDFTSKINCSFKKNLGQSTKLIGTNGEIFVENTWTCNPVKITLNGNNYDDFDHNFNNLYSYEIEKVSECLLNNREDSIYPSMNRYETLENMKILNKWMEID